MPYVCCVVGCSSRRVKGSGLKFYQIPSIIEGQGTKTKEITARRRAAWIAKIDRKNWRPSEHTRVCSRHFVSGEPSGSYEETHPDWVPTRYMGYKSTPGSMDRYLRQQKRQQKFRQPVTKRRKEQDNETSTEEASGSVLEPDTPDAPERADVGCQTELSGEDIDALLQQSLGNVDVGCETESCNVVCETDLSGDDMIKLEKEIEEMHLNMYGLRKDIEELKRELGVRTLSENALKESNKLLKFYTGIHEWCVFDALFNLASKYIPRGTKLSKFAAFVMFFMKIRLSLQDEDIAFRFGCHVSTVSRSFHRVLDILFMCTAECIKWPDRDVLRLTMPASFRKFFKKCAVIIDCTEIFIERPSDLLARAQVWSNYKHHSTAKFLIGITPQGTVSYVSKCAGGRISDKEIVEKSNLIDFLLPGDVILADRGFTCDEYARMVLAEVKTPPFTRGKSQLEKVDVDWSRELSLVRIHVERVIGVLKQKYTILQGVLPIALVAGTDGSFATIDKIVRVCCALVNLCPSVVPQD